MTSHVWAEVRDEHVPCDPVGPDGQPSWEHRRFWRFSVCGSEESTLVWKEYHSISGSTTDETCPPDYEGCDPDVHVVYDVITT